MAYQLGMNAKLYYEDGGYSPDAGAGNKPDITTGVGTELSIVKDVTLNLEQAEADVTTRGNNGWRATVGTLKEGSIETQIQWDTANAAFNVILAAWLNNTIIGIAALDTDYSATVSGTGLVSNFAVTNFTRNEALEEALVADVTLKPTYSDVVPAWLSDGAFI